MKTSIFPRKFLISLALTLQLAVFGSCASAPQSHISTDSDFETIVIVGTNDIHGTLAPLKLKTRESEGVAPTDYQAGGAMMLASYLRKLQQEYGDKLIWLDAGDEFQGSIESNSEKGAPMVRFFNATGLNGAAIGNHEFDYGPLNDPNDRLGTLKARTSEANYPYIAANIVDEKTGKVAPFPNAVPSKLMKVGGLNVGVIGLSTLETPLTTFPPNLRGLLFKSLEESAIREAKILRNEGAEIVLLTAHVGIKCELGRVSPAQTVRKHTDALGFCDDDSELVRFLRKMPPGTIDAVVSGHSHQVIHHWVEGVPVVQGGSNAKYINVIYLTYDRKNKRVAPDRTLIEGPIPVCPLVFENQGDCNGDRPAPKGGRGSLVEPEFHGEILKPDPNTAELLKSVFEKSAQIRAELITHAIRPIEHDRRKESEIGNLVTDAMRIFTSADAAIVNSGGIRAPWEQGPIRYENVFRTLPFDNTITVLSITGKELKTILRVMESGGRGFHAVSGLRLRLIPLDQEAPADDLNADGKIEPWEVNRLLEVTLADGTAVRDSATYTVALPDFLALGGDDMKWPMSKISRDKMKMSERTLRDVVLEHLKTRAPTQAGWNSPDHPLVDPKKPRFLFSKKRKSRRS